ncbi:predicted protein [Sparassis crispa]|uniref:Uncharacterized protein n=1 Tax=Sparassis crispa TaxID=139825 RepID=A0A401GSH4_9APHY|nr:predicted protein [Sparassis crispa]GBE85120.1 predicted protein [Sparassis crispa]
MTSRPLPSKSRHSRPLSAIFIGSVSSNSTPPSIPDLPEPPSPSSSTGSGLPSPPATNSTGSGSIGYQHSYSAGSLRQRSASRSSVAADMVKGDYDRSRSSGNRNRTASADDDDAFENENEEDNTARFANGRRLQHASVDNMSTLQRVKNLTQRNRLVLDKLTSISRLSSPAPTNSSHPPISPPNASSSSTSSSRLSSSHVRPVSMNGYAALRRFDSGSETERESQSISNYYSSSDDLSATPPSVPQEIHTPVPGRERRPSAPAIPGSLVRPSRDGDRAPSPGPSRAPRKRVSMAMSVDETRSNRWRDDEQDVTTAALAAVASSRRSPQGTNGSSRRNRQPLPREFREGERPSSEVKANGEPSTPHRPTERYSSPAFSPHASTSMIPTNPQTSPRRSGTARYSTVRELTRKHQTRWLSEDLSNGNGDENSPTPGSGGVPGRRQGHRGGSSDGLLVSTSGRSLLGEGLRAAGLTKRRDAGDDVFTDESPTTPVVPRLTKSTGNASVNNGDWGDASLGQSKGVGLSTRVSEGVGPPGSNNFESRTPVTTSQRRGDRNSYSGVPIRPGTSMAALHHESPDNPPRTAPPALRTYKSVRPLPDRDSPASRQARQEPVQTSSDLAYSSPLASYASHRSSTAPPPSSKGQDANAEHRRLMLEALGMFESHLSRLPPMGQTTTNTIPGLFQSAQHLVHTLDKMNGMLRAGTHKALEAQIDAEVADSAEEVDPVNLWRQVGADHRENLRVSDEVVRNMTGFLLGVGKVLRDASALHGQHLRSVSLDDDAAKRGSPDVNGDRVASGSRPLDGRQSREIRRSWDAKDLRTLTMSSVERSVGSTRPASSLNILRRPGTSSSDGRSADATHEQTPPAMRNNSTAIPASSSTRRFFTTRERRGTPEQDSALAPIITSLDSQDTTNSYEPSPTPTSRHSRSALSERPRTAIPPSLSTLPSESLLSCASTVDTDKLSRRKISSNSNITVRAESSTINSVIKPPNPTTALTNATVSNSPDTRYPVLRSESSGSGRTNGVTFSRPSTISVSTLNGLQQQLDRDTRARTSSTISAAEEPIYLAPAAVISRSETERDKKRRTLGARSRISLDSAFGEEGGSVDSSASSILSSSLSSSARRERRRTINEIFSQR